MPSCGTSAPTNPSFFRFAPWGAAASRDPSAPDLERVRFLSLALSLYRSRAELGVSSGALVTLHTIWDELGERRCVRAFGFDAVVPLTRIHT